ncbi:arylesterase [Hydrogenophaga sp.]|uniref:arylesterase n=1 Tax=Hydrogenophaga sp. TaxID=1904254 RepID=UPI003FA52F9C
MEGLLKLKRRHFNALVCSVCALAAAGSLGNALAQAPAQAASSNLPVVLVVGDSLSAEYGLKRGTGWVALLSETMGKEKVKARVVNASISGDTTSGGRSRIAALLKQHKPKWVVIELGGNDALRGLPLNMTRDNLATMARLSREAGAQVLLLGMEMPPNYGAKYAQEFRDLYTTVAKAEKTVLVPFFLKGVADTKDPTALFQADRIHPNERAQATMRDNVWPELRKLITRR